jgi:hypothetical protein
MVVGATKEEFLFDTEAGRQMRSMGDHRSVA